MEISGINSQNIPSRGDGKITRMLFTAKKEFNEIEVDVDRIVIPEISEIETTDGWKYGKDLKVCDQILTDEGPVILEIIRYDEVKKEYELIVRKI